MQIKIKMEEYGSLADMQDKVSANYYIDKAISRVFDHQEINYDDRRLNEEAVLRAVEIAKIELA